MPTAGIIEGVNLKLLSNTVQISHLTSCSLDTGSEEIDLTSYDSSGWKDITIGTQSWSISGEAFVAYDAAEGYDELLADKIAKTTVTVLLSTEVTGDSTFSGSAKITSLNKSADLSSGVKFTFTYTGSGAPAIGTVA